MLLTGRVVSTEKNKSRNTLTNKPEYCLFDNTAKSDGEINNPILVI